MPNVIGSFEELRKNVIEETRYKASAYQEEAGAKIQKIKQENKKKVKNIEEEISKQANQKAEQLRFERLEKAKKEALRKRLNVRQDLLNQVWEGAEKQLRSLVNNSEAYLQSLYHLARLSVEVLGPGKIELAPEPKGYEALTADVLENWSEKISNEYQGEIIFIKSSKTIDSWGGLIAKKVASNRRLDARFSERLEIAHDELREEIFAILMDENEQ